MDFTPSPEQEALRETARSFLAEHSSSERVRRAMESETGFDAETWKRIGAELGWPALIVPEAHGGLGLGWVELGVLLVTKRSGAELALERDEPTIPDSLHLAVRQGGDLVVRERAHRRGRDDPRRDRRQRQPKGVGTLQAHLEGETALERDRVLEDEVQAREQPVEDESLASAADCLAVTA